MYTAVTHHYATTITNVSISMQAYGTFTWCFFMANEQIG